MKARQNRQNPYRSGNRHAFSKYIQRAVSLFVAVLGFGLASLTQAAIPASERAVLNALYTQTNGANWTSKSGWGGAAGTECSWYGISCDTNLAHVVQVVLSSNNLTGTIPSLSGLTKLQDFQVNNNQLTGSIPSLSGLTNLQDIDVGFNQLTGSIPSLSGLTNLQVFSAWTNQLTGSIPSLSGLTNLQYFFVPSNQLTGPIPSLSGLSNLKYFYAFYNQLTGGIPPLIGLTNLVDFNVSYNQLTGTISTLSGLTNLQGFGVYDNQLTGGIPAITGITKIHAFLVAYNQLTGALPSLAGLMNLQNFDARGNRLTGGIPSLTGLTGLEYFLVDSNGLTGDVPAAPPALIAGKSTLCNNPLNHTTNAAWDAATGISPWYSTCTSSPSTVTIITNDVTVATGTSTTITATIATPGKALTADTGTSSTVNGTVSDDSGNILCYMVLVNGTGSCNVILPAGSTLNLTGGYSGTPTIAAASAIISKHTPVTTPGNLDQHGWTGSWYNPATGGQGIVVEVYPDLLGLGTGLFGAGWFTYDTTAGGEDHKRWYTLQGPVSSTSPTTTLNIIAPTGGNFNAGPVITTNNGESIVGTATLNFTDCQHGTLSYRFTTPDSRQNQLNEPTGNIPLIRGDANVTCDPINGNGSGAIPGTYLLSGAWYDPATSGQGILFDIDPIQGPQGNLFAAWYTYAPNGQAIGGGASQRWYTLQIASANVGATTLSNISIYSPQGGVLDSPGGVSTPQVGTASMVFTSCNALMLTYSFTSGTNSGQSGTINLQRVGPTPAGCTL